MHLWNLVNKSLPIAALCRLPGLMYTLTFMCMYSCKNLSHVKVDTLGI